MCEVILVKSTVSYSKVINFFIIIIIKNMPNNIFSKVSVCSITSIRSVMCEVILVKVQ